MTHLGPNHLLKLLAILDAGSFSLAAGRLGLTQPALTRAVRLLEDEVGGRVLERGRHGAVATPLGEVLAVHARAVRASLQRAVEDAAHHRRGLGGPLTIGATPLLAAAWVAAPIVAFMRDRPDITVRLTEGTAGRLMDLLAAREIDLFVGPAALVAPGEKHGIERSIVRDDELILLARHGHPLAGRTGLGKDDLAAYRWVANSPGAFLRQQAEAILLSARVDARVAVETDSAGAVIGLLEGGDFLALLPRGSVEGLLEAGRVVALDFVPPANARPLAAFHRDRRELAPLVQHFLDFLIATLRAGRAGPIPD